MLNVKKIIQTHALTLSIPARHTSLSHAISSATVEDDDVDVVDEVVVTGVDMVDVIDDVAGVMVDVVVVADTAAVVVAVVVVVP